MEKQKRWKEKIISKTCIICILNTAGWFGPSTPTEAALPHKYNDANSFGQEHKMTFSFKLHYVSPTQPEAV